MEKERTKPAWLDLFFDDFVALIREIVDYLIAEDSHWTTAGFIEINNQGQILGVSEGHAVILTPGLT